METKKVISRKNLPTKLPIMSSLLVYLMLDYYDASQLVKGIVYGVFAFLWIGTIILFFKEKDIDVLNNK